MSMVRFATLCDRCDKRSPEYTPFQWCNECGDDLCPECSGVEVDGEYLTIVCKQCQEEQS